MTNGTTNVYLSCPLNGNSPTGVFFDLLMDFYPQQQNKMTFIHRESKSSYVFLPYSRKQEIILATQ
jgi:hypothetical protein